tara:strand:+ start:427 stop:597 length:171 start_codon:yes stop_codon:yes gene_type:complete
MNEMGTSWIKRHAHEEPDRRKREKARYMKWRAQFTTNGKWDDAKVKAWMKERDTDE